MTSRIHYFIFGAAGCMLAVVAFAAGMTLRSSSPMVRPAASLYPLLNPTITSESGKHFIINFLPLKKQFVEIQKRYVQKTYVYFAYLNNASWIGLGEKDYFYAASTTKVPLAMAVLKAVEDGKLKLDQHYTLDELDLNKDFGQLYQAGTDNEFTLNELLTIMLEQSDNTATLALFHVFNKIGIENPFEQVYAAMGWEFTDIDAKPDYRTINLKTLANMFLALYNAKYIAPEHSELILHSLAHTPFVAALVAGVPTNITVAHKVGVADEYKTYSDCGIVYAPNRHYILCASLVDADQKTADAFIAETSRAAYDYVINN